MNAQTIVTRCAFCRTAEDVASGRVTSSCPPDRWARMCAGRKGGTCRNPYPIQDPSTVDELIAALDAAASEATLVRAHERYVVATASDRLQHAERCCYPAVAVSPELLRDLVALAERAVR